MSKKDCTFRFQGHYVKRQIFPNGRYKIMVWTKSNPLQEELCADVAFCGDSHKKCINKLKNWLDANKDWVNGEQEMNLLPELRG